MRRNLVVISGGSGSGKTTLAIALATRHSDNVALLHLDDYYKREEDAPRRADGSVDWDHPDALCFDDMVRDVDTLIAGEPVTVYTKSELYNPGYRPELKNKIPHTVQPKPLLVLEGYLALHDSRVRERAALSIFLTIPIEESLRRRGANKFTPSPEYVSQVLIPVHRTFVEPLQAYADKVIDVSHCAVADVVQEVETELVSRGLLPGGGTEGCQEATTHSR